MSTLEFDFVKSPAPTMAGLFLLACGSILAGWCAWEYVQADNQVKHQASAWEQWESHHRKLKAERPKIPADQLEAEQRRQKDIRTALDFPWPALFEQLEAAASDEVAILAIQPDLRKKQLRIDAEAKDYKAVTAYIEKLGSQPRLRDVHLLKHQVEVEAKQQPVSFSIGAEWGAL